MACKYHLSIQLTQRDAKHQRPSLHNAINGSFIYPIDHLPYFVEVQYTNFPPEYIQQFLFPAIIINNKA